MVRLLVNLWGAVPLHRGQADIDALRRALKALEADRILGLAPEGARSGHGRLQPGHPGVVFLALRSGAPLLPAVRFGGKLFWRNLPRLRRTDFRIVVDQPFHLDAGDIKVTRTVRQQMADEIMYQIAAFLPALKVAFVTHRVNSPHSFSWCAVRTYGAFGRHAPLGRG